MDAFIQPATCKLNEQNYHLWKLRTESTLKAKDAWLAIVEDDPGNVPEEAERKARWDKANNIAMGYMTNTIDDAVLGQFINVRTPKELWNALMKKYEAHADIRKIELRNEIASLKMHYDEDWKQYIMRSVNLGERAKSMGMDVTDNEIAYNVVKGLPTRYHILKTSFAAQATIDMDLLKRALAAEDGNGRQNGDAAFKAKAQHRQSKGGDERCWHCNKRGHKRADCWKLHGKPKGRGGQTAAANTGNKYANYNRNAEAKIIQDTACPEEQLWFVGNESERKTWILDSGATSHMCSQRQWMRDFTPENRTVRLADEAVTDIKGRGTVKLRMHETGVMITVTDVLWVPNLRGNLFSVSKITHDCL